MEAEQIACEQSEKRAIGCFNSSRSHMAGPLHRREHDFQVGSSRLCPLNFSACSPGHTLMKKQGSITPFLTSPRQSLESRLDSRLGFGSSAPGTSEAQKHPPAPQMNHLVEAGRKTKIGWDTTAMSEDPISRRQRPLILPQVENVEEPALTNTDY